MRDKLENIFKEVLNDQEFELKDELTEKDVPSWNSFNNVLLINKIETDFAVKFGLHEVLKLKNIGDIIQLIETKQKA